MKNYYISLFYIFKLKYSTLINCIEVILYLFKNKKLIDLHNCTRVININFCVKKNRKHENSFKQKGMFLLFVKHFVIKLTIKSEILE